MIKGMMKRIRMMMIFNDLGDSQEMDADIRDSGHLDRGRFATPSGGKAPTGAKTVADHYVSEGSVEKKVPKKNKVVENIAAETEDGILGMKDGASDDEGCSQGRVEVGISQSPTSIAHLFSASTEDGSPDRDQTTRWESFLEQGNSGGLLKAMGLMEEEIMDSQEDLGKFVIPKMIEGSEQSM
jgi:hypothetical protein